MLFKYFWHIIKDLQSVFVIIFAVYLLVSEVLLYLTLVTEVLCHLILVTEVMWSCF